MSTPLQFGGEEAFAAPPQRLFALLSDIDTMAAHIPDLASWEKVSEQEMRCVVRPGFSFLRGTMKLTIGLRNVVPPERAVMAIDAAGIGVSMHVDSSFAISPDGAGSRLAWQADVTQMKGLVATVSPALVRAAADQVIRHAWGQVRRELGEG